MKRLQSISLQQAVCVTSGMLLCVIDVCGKLAPPPPGSLGLALFMYKISLRHVIPQAFHQTLHHLRSGRMRQACPRWVVLHSFILAERASSDTSGGSSGRGRGLNLTTPAPNSKRSSTHQPERMYMVGSVAIMYFLWTVMLILVGMEEGL